MALRLQNDYAAGLQPPSAALARPLVGEEGQLINGAGHKALPPVEIGEAARGRRVILIV